MLSPCRNVLCRRRCWNCRFGLFLLCSRLLTIRTCSTPSLHAPRIGGHWPAPRDRRPACMVMPSSSRLAMAVRHHVHDPAAMANGTDDDKGDALSGAPCVRLSHAPAHSPTLFPFLFPCAGILSIRNTEDRSADSQWPTVRHCTIPCHAAWPYTTPPPPPPLSTQRVCVLPAAVGPAPLTQHRHLKHTTPVTRLCSPNQAKSYTHADDTRTRNTNRKNIDTRDQHGHARRANEMG